MPFSYGGRLSLFYLFDRRAHRSKRGLGAHQWAHISTENLTAWQEQPMAVEITDDWEGSICTGSVFYDKGTYYAFYAVRTTDGSPAKLTCSTSKDGIHFIKTEKYFTLREPYQAAPARDPVVFFAKGQYHMLVTTELTNSQLEGKGGCLAHLTSDDLIDWVQEPPFIVPGYADQPECADIFEWNGRCYLLYANNGITRYRSLLLDCLARSCTAAA